MPYEVGTTDASRPEYAVDALDAKAPALLPQPPTFPRELSHTELAALLRASDDDCRLVILLLMNGLSVRRGGQVALE